MVSMLGALLKDLGVLLSAAFLEGVSALLYLVLVFEGLGL